MPTTSRFTILPKWLYSILAVISLAISSLFTFLLITRIDAISDNSFFFLLVLYGICIAILIFCITEIVADVRGKIYGFTIKAGGPLAAIILVILMGSFYKQLFRKNIILNIQLYGKNLGDIPLKNLPNALVLIPVNNSKATVSDIDPKGIASYSLSNEYFEKEVRFQLLSNQFVLDDPNKLYKINYNNELKIRVIREKCKFKFTILDKSTGKPIRNVRMISPELRLDTLSDKFGTIVHYADTSNLQTYNFSFDYPNYRYNSQREYYTNQLSPIFLLEKVH